MTSPDTSHPEYLIAVAVGPVQEFIAAARKLRDLWYGSYLLSELSKAVALSLKRQGCRLIFPAVSDPAQLQPDSSLNVANKIIAEAFNGASPESILSVAREDFFNFWKSLGQKASNNLRPDEIHRDRFELQMDDFGEFFGAWVTWNRDYESTRNELELRLAGRKSLRDFSSPTWKGEGLPKSSLDGIRESVLKNPSLLVKRNLLKKNEHLDALGIVKRIGYYGNPHRPHFDNFSEIAVQPYLEGLKAGIAQGQGHISQIIEKISQKATLAPQSESLSQERFSRQELIANPLPNDFFLISRMEEWLRDYDLNRNEKWNHLKKVIIGELFQKTREPLPYSALMVGDGDHMGKTIDQMKDMVNHRNFSKALAGFSETVGKVVHDHGGRLIYSGGDDVMAYLPLHRLLNCAVAVNDCFQKSVTQACRQMGCTAAPTFSMGIAVVHHLMPLHEALSLARRAESHAKLTGGRNALTIIQAKRSGSPITVFGKWNTPDDPQGFPHRFSEMIQWYHDGRLPSRLGYDLKLSAKTSGKDMQWQNTSGRFMPGNPPAAEALRIVLRKQGQGGASFTMEEAQQLLNRQPDMERLADELIVAYQLAQAGLIAAGQWKRQREDD